MKIWPSSKPTPQPPAPKYPGVEVAMDGSAAVVAMETAASEGAGAYPITPSTQMGEGWAVAVAEGARNVNGRRLLFFEPEGEHAAAAVTAGMSMTGLRATNFSSGQGIAYMHESLYAAVGKRLTYVLNVAARAITKHALNVHAGHDDYHAVDDTGFFQLFAKDVQEVADLNLIAHRIAELSLNPGIVAQDGFLTSHVIESLRLPERALVREFLGDPSDTIVAPTPAQRLVYGESRRRIPELFDVDRPTMIGVVQNQDSYAQGVAAQRPFYFDHVADLTDQSFAEYAALTGRRYARASGYRLDDAQWVIAGQGSVVANAEAVCDWLRTERGLRVGVLNLTMFRPFPADLITRLLRDKRGVVVLERTDQPLAVDPPLLREIRAAMTQAMENGREAEGSPLPYPRLAAIQPFEVPDFFSGCFGLGSRDLQPGDVVAAVTNMVSGARRRQFYLGIDFVRDATLLPKLQIWQEQLVDAYPALRGLALAREPGVTIIPKGAVSVRIHSVGGWGAITMGKNLASTVFELFGMRIKANPKYGSEKKGQPTTFYATFAREDVRLNCELHHVDVVLSPDPNVFLNSDPLDGLAEGGTFVAQSDRTPEAFWDTLPASAQRAIRERNLRVFVLDAFAIAAAEASSGELRFRMQGAAFMGAFFAVSPLLEREGASRETLFAGIRKQLTKKFGKLGERVVEDNVRVIERGFAEAREVDWRSLPTSGVELGGVPTIPPLLDVPDAEQGVSNGGRFWEQVCYLCKTGKDGIADPYAATGTMPAATGVVRDMTNVRHEVPSFIAEKCTGCAQCWTQCPDAAIPGLVVELDALIDVAMGISEGGGHQTDRVRQVAKHLARELRATLGSQPFAGAGPALDVAYAAVCAKLGWDAERRAELDTQYAAVRDVIGTMPLAKTSPFFDRPEALTPGTGGLLAITVNPEACKACNICVDACPDGALVSVKQDTTIVERLRKNWRTWERLPDTPDRFVNVRDLDQGIGVLSSLLLRKQTYRSMVGGDGACMGCGEKTSVHLVVSTIDAFMQPRVARHVAHLEALIAQLDARARGLLAAGADLDRAAAAAEAVDVPLAPATRAEIERLTKAKHAIEDLLWRYRSGPAGRGRARMAMANSTGCSSVWASTYPYNPYPFPWANHLFQDSPSLAIGVFEGHMRKMADGFAAVRRAELLATGEYDADAHEPELSALDWRGFTDEEFTLCPPIVAMGGDGAMLDIGFQNLSRLFASGRPIRVVVLDTQVYSNTGGQACTSGFTGQVADMSAWGKAQHGKTEARKELGLIAIAHRGVYVHQTSQASPSHLVGGLLRGLSKRRPVLVNVYTPCPVEHGLADDWAVHAAKLALESRAFPFLTYDPDAGSTFADALSLEGNPSVEDRWPTYTLHYVDDAGGSQSIELPLTIADWAATEGRFRKNFERVADDDPRDLVPFHEYLDLPHEERDGKTPFIHTLDDRRRLRRTAVSVEMVRLAEERLEHWSQLKQLAGLEIPQTIRDRLGGNAEADYQRQLDALRAEYDAKLAALQASYPVTIARRLAEGLLRSGDASRTVGDLLASALSAPVLAESPDEAIGSTALAALAPVVPPAPATNGHRPTASAAGASGTATLAPPPVASAAPSTPASPPASAAAVATAPADGLAMDAYIESARCTSCNECINLNKRMFSYNAEKQAVVKDAHAGSFQQLVLAAERCPVGAIHPGTPLNPSEKDLAKWVERARPFN